MAKPKTTPRALPGDDSKVVGTSTSNVTPITGRARRKATDEKSLPAEAARTSSPGATEAAPAIIVFGKDEAGKPHASWFGEADAALAERAAGLMGYRVLRVTSPDIAAKALELAAGRIFAQSGRGFVPFCRTALYEALNGYEGAFAPPPPPEPQPEPPLAVTGTPQRWEDIGRHVGRRLVTRWQRFEQRGDRLAKRPGKGFEQVDAWVLSATLDPADVARLAGRREAKRLLREATGDP